MILNILIIVFSILTLFLWGWFWLLTLKEFFRNKKAEEYSKEEAAALKEIDNFTDKQEG